MQRQQPGIRHMSDDRFTSVEARFNMDWSRTL
jgi:hypothetical protein